MIIVYAHPFEPVVRSRSILELGLPSSANGNCKWPLPVHWNCLFVSNQGAFNVSRVSGQSALITVSAVDIVARDEVHLFIAGDVVQILNMAMTLLRRCRVNAALTIQLFSQLFHFINMWLFNCVVLQPKLQLCSRAWGARFYQRLSYVQAWAEQQGLELAADCHLTKVLQVQCGWHYPAYNFYNIVWKLPVWFRKGGIFFTK